MVWSLLGDHRLDKLRRADPYCRLRADKITFQSWHEWPLNPPFALCGLNNSNCQPLSAFQQPFSNLNKCIWISAHLVFALLFHARDEANIEPLERLALGIFAKKENDRVHEVLLWCFYNNMQPSVLFFYYHCLWMERFLRWKLDFLGPQLSNNKTWKICLGYLLRNKVCQCHDILRSYQVNDANGESNW